MSLVSTNYFWMRIVAFLTMMFIGAIISLYDQFLAVAVVSFLGAWNVLEPKAVEENLQKWKEIFEKSKE